MPGARCVRIVGARGAAGEVMVTTRLGLAAIAALLGAAGCNQILGTTPPLPFGEGGPTPCGDAEWTHWHPTGTHVYDTTGGATARAT